MHPRFDSIPFRMDRGRGLTGVTKPASRTEHRSMTYRGARQTGENATETGNGQAGFWIWSNTLRPNAPPWIDRCINSHQMVFHTAYSTSIGP